MPKSTDPEKGPSETAAGNEKPSPMSLAVEWVARITAVALMMVLPGIAGGWLDGKFGTGFLALLGFGFGFCAGFVSLLAMVNTKKSSG